MKRITPKLLREAQTYLHSGDDSGDGTDYCCHAVASAAGEEYAGETSKGFEQKLREWGFLLDGRVALHFEPMRGRNPYTATYYTRRQGARFMLLELLALAIEDGAL